MDRKQLDPLIGKLKDVLLDRVSEVGQLARLIQELEGEGSSDKENIQSVEAGVYINQYDSYRARFSHDTCEKERIVLDEIMREVGIFKR